MFSLLRRITYLNRTLGITISSATYFFTRWIYIQHPDLSVAKFLLNLFRPKPLAISFHDHLRNPSQILSLYKQFYQLGTNRNPSRWPSKFSPTETLPNPELNLTISKVVMACDSSSSYFFVLCEAHSHGLCPHGFESHP